MIWRLADWARPAHADLSKPKRWAQARGGAVRGVCDIDMAINLPIEMWQANGVLRCAF